MKVSFKNNYVGKKQSFHFYDLNDLEQIAGRYGISLRGLNFRETLENDNAEENFSRCVWAKDNYPVWSADFDQFNVTQACYDLFSIMDDYSCLSVTDD